ncbi:MAG TPA: UDP-N-acetylmuramoyl-tripeptide--D-alanyl-D-alanine ligase, partial [Clostridiaceae bacterium]|nr:UDP-N-acetylmuramoyl-tripeptide--D-alanyl-D-alanine ligase [Clostridiaceae bacterium]
MEALNIKEIVSATGGTLVNCSEDMIVNGISTDSRDINAGDLFVALKGKNFNGHDFIPKALESGCTAVLASEE